MSGAALPNHPPSLLLEIRPARLADAPALEVLQQRAARAIAARAHGAPAIEAWIRHVGTLDRELISGGTYLVAVADGLLVGCGGWSVRRRGHGAAARTGVAGERPLDPAPEPAWIRALFVEPRFTRCGVGRTLLAAAERAAAREGPRLATLDAMPSGEWLYRRAGYRAVGPLSVALPEGLRLPLLRMEKPLTPAAERSSSAAASASGATPSGSSS
jgi:GNAT superfamily N-acetyltransferase